MKKPSAPPRLISASCSSNSFGFAWPRVHILSFLVLLALPALPTNARAQTRAWALLGGANYAEDQPPVYGAQGTPSNSVNPGNRTEALTWVDAQGNLWLFGGDAAKPGGGGIVEPSDLWKFDTATAEWTWVSGTSTSAPAVYGKLGEPAPGNTPGSRQGAFTWVDSGGNLWLFSGGSVNSVNDLWAYSPATLEWTWMGGNSPAACGNNSCPVTYGMKGTPSTSNLPGARGFGGSWVDTSGNFWLFGGDGIDSAGKSGFLNDLWEYTPSTGAWTWVSGSNLANPSGNYGQLQTPATTNVPGPRTGESNWTDAGGNLWLFGGSASTDGGSPSILNDLWEFVPSTAEWTWMGGSDQPNQGGNFGSLGGSSASYIPAARENANSWVDSSGNFWLFGGDNSNVPPGSLQDLILLNDLWEFNPSTLVWTWASGGASPSCGEYDLGDWACFDPGVYGTLGVPGPLDLPPGRSRSLGWADNQQNFWIWGGGIYSASSAGCCYEQSEEVWVDTAEPAPTFSVGSGTYAIAQTVSITDAIPGAEIHFTVDGTEPTLSSPQYSGPIAVGINGQTLQAFAVPPIQVVPSPLTSATYNFSSSSASSAARPVFSPSPGAYKSAQSVTLTDATPGASIYYSIGTTPGAASTLYTGPIAVSGDEIIEAIAVAPGYSTSKEVSGNYQIDTTTATLSLSGTNPNLTLECSVAGPAGRVNVPKPTGTITFTDTTTGQALGTASVGDQGVIPSYQLISNPVGTHPSGVVSGDFNGDGITDLAAANGYDGTVSILLGNGDGTFQPQIVYSVGPIQAGIVVADFNNDKKLDLALVIDNTAETSVIAILLGNGDGTFTPAQVSPPASPMPIGILAGDFAGNGNAGLAIWDGSRVSVLMGNGNGTFQAPVETTHLPIASNIVAGDLNGDGKTDLVFAGSTSTAKFSVLLSNGDGTFQLQPLAASAQLPFVPDAFTLADVNGDGRLDLVAFEGVDSGPQAWLGVVLGNGDGTFQYSPELDQLFSDSAGFLPGAISVGKFNGDEAVDIAAVNTRENEADVFVFKGAGNGTFGSPTSVPVGSKPVGVVPFNLTGGTQTAFAAASDTANDVSVSVPQVQQFGSGAISKIAIDADGYSGHGLQCSYSGDSNYRSSISNTADLFFTTAQPPLFSLLVGVYPSAQQVSITGGATGAAYYYTTDGSDPTTNSTLYRGPITVTSSVKLKAIAAGPYLLTSGISEAVYTIADPPQLSAPSGTTNKPQVVTIADSTPGAAIYYTTDGTTPSTKSAKYTGPITLIKTSTVKAFATATGYIDSAISATTYDVQLPVPAIAWPTPAAIVYGAELSAKELDAKPSVAGKLAYSPGFGSILGAGEHTLTVGFTPADPDAYSSTTKTVKIEVTKRALAVAAYSETVLYGTTLPKLIYSITGFVDRDTVAVVRGKPIETTTAKVGSLPGAYPITIRLGTLSTANYRFEMKDGELTIKPLGTLAKPTFDPPGATYASPQTVSIDSRRGATIYYSVRIGGKTSNVVKYTGPVKVSQTETIEAYASEKGYIKSAVAEAKYTVQ